jgi:hypothetical protein
MTMDDDRIRQLARSSSNRLAFWSEFVRAAEVRSVAEVGVYRGAYAQHILDECSSVERYYMVDPWRHLEDWNKPANQSDQIFEDFYNEAMDRTEAHAGKRVVLRGRLQDVVDDIPDQSVDFAYIDGDHTLRGITIDLTRMMAKIAPGGWLAGDDFCPSIFQHAEDFEPTMVFPYAVYFAEAVDLPIYAVRHRQFLIRNDPSRGFAFHDFTGRYADTTVKHQLDKMPGQAAAGSEAAPESVARRALGRVRTRLGAVVSR